MDRRAARTEVVSHLSAKVAWIQHLEHGLRFFETTETCMKAMVPSIYRRPLYLDTLIQYVDIQRSELVGDIAVMSHELHCTGEHFGALYTTSLLSRLDVGVQLKPGTRDPGVLAAQVQELLDAGDVGQAVLLQEILLRSCAEKNDTATQYIFDINLKRYMDIRTDLRQMIRRIRSDNAPFAPTFNIIIQSGGASRFLPLADRYFTLNEEPGLLGRNALHVAAGVNCSDIIAPLLRQGVDINAADEFGLPPLHVGCIHASVEAVDDLLEHGARGELQDKEERTALHYAAVTGRASMVRGILAVDRTTGEVKDRYGRTPLSYAAIFGHETVVDLLLQTANVDPDSKDEIGRTPLSFAAAEGHGPIVSRLLATGKVHVGSTNKVGWGPLAFAVENGKEDVVKMLLSEPNINVNPRDATGCTPLVYAAQHGYAGIVQLLLRSRDIDVNSRNCYGRTPLSYAAANGHVGVVKLLLAAGCDPSVASLDGKTTLSYAVENNQADVEKVLREVTKYETRISSYNYTLPSSLFLNTTARAPYTIKATTNVDLVRLDTSGLPLILNFSAITTPGNTMSPKVTAMECALYFCVSTHQAEAEVKRGDLTEDSFPTMTISNHSTTDLTLNTCNYAIHWLSILAMRNTLGPLVSGFGTLPVSNRPYFASDTLRALYGQCGNLTQVNGTFASITAALTANARNCVCQGSVPGDAWTSESYISIRWLWILLSVVLVVLCILFFIVPVIHTRNQYIWKSSPLALLCADLHIDGSAQPLKSGKIDPDQKRLDDVAELSKSNLKMEQRNGTTDATSDAVIDFAFYRYDPSMAGAVIFVILFSITTLWHAFQLIRTRTWFFIPFLTGGIFESIGYAGRAMSSSQSPNWTLGPYLIQTMLLLLAPALLAASVYMLLGRIILVLRAESHAMLKKKWLTKVFVTGDVLSFLLQGTGGGIQSSGSIDSMKFGEHIIVAGLFVQILFFGFFIITAGSFDMKLRRYPIPRCFEGRIPWRKHLNVLYGTSVLILIRSVFRLVEYLQGNDGFLLHHEIFLYIFDAVLIFIAMAVFNISHPSEIAKYMDSKEDLELSEGYSSFAR
ncbi:hypothetical protein CNMCM6106_006339 [Aspergillus hiratsukae]|uniref:Uncharacterized protein n=1 Tax=Aspergillus hiratsukae TaxID=1194566 RepID=A0A8H6QGW7_9EURO|nr:hypothetical protein CNMCM6106_006339 [Aspergillus hiratsukae]